LLFVITLIFFIFASGISLKKNILKIFKFNKTTKPFYSEDINEINKEFLPSENTIKEKPQRSFIFERQKKPTIESKISFKLPNINLLEVNKTKINPVEINKSRPNSDFMEKILLDFGIEGKIKKINNGPVVSLYEFEPAPGVKVSKVINLSDDLARNTSSTSTRVSVIPGKNTVGIEIPNEIREDVALREIITNEKFLKKEVKLPIALGKSISGVPIIGDLTAMPHLLIAGTTGSGKSVCINTIIVSLLYKLEPDICKFI
jgi:S-DNA-T family DNA segregation ATPase FtsK/SpoIIIE